MKIDSLPNAKALERKLRAEARRKFHSVKSKRARAYIYGTLRKTGWKPRRRARRAHRNPATAGYIGSNVRLYPGGHFPGSRLRVGNHAGAVVLEGRGRWPRMGDKVRRVDYDNKGKAQRAYGRPGRFMHKFTSPVSVSHVELRPGNTWRAILRSPANIWKRG
ncbi:MAG: hypothetical protein KGO96_13780 [Elusimicrobia bacterium]|nr:hypothetical protein [Elusimicrobiota bacterium]MDE2236269.1 hypothetical protein [Elusimicrobiota bacterium]MDE2426965.1 hypothetical protein [Elusimicrobiota bacterium]